MTPFRHAQIAARNVLVLSCASLAMAGCTSTTASSAAEATATATATAEPAAATFDPKTVWDQPKPDIAPPLKMRLQRDWPQPELTKAAKDPTSAGGEAFLEYALNVFAWSLRTGDPELLRSICDTPSKGWAKDKLEYIESMEEESEALAVDGGYDVVSTQRTGSNSDTYFTLNFTANRSKYYMVDPSDGALKGTYEAAEEALVAEVRWRNGKWHLIGVFGR